MRPWYIVYRTHHTCTSIETLQCDVHVRKQCEFDHNWLGLIEIDYEHIYNAFYQVLYISVCGFTKLQQAGGP